VTLGSLDRDSKLKRVPKVEIKPSQIFKQKYDMTNFSVKCKVFKYKIPKLKKQTKGYSDSEEQSIKDVCDIKGQSSQKSFLTASTKTIVEVPSGAVLLSSRNNFDLMKKKVVQLLDRPCYKFLQNEDCGLYCTYNHVLPSALIVAENIKDSSNDLVQFFYTTYI
jgi:hypothetical protein